MLRIGDAAPTFRLPDLSGGEYELSGAGAKAVVVNFWASWCRPCGDEMPHLEKLYHDYGDRGLRIVGVADDAEAAAKSSVNYHGVTYTIVLNGEGENSVFDAYHVGALPTNYVLDADLRIVDRFEGWDEERLMEALRKLGVTE